jgi:hypothetical protein
VGDDAVAPGGLRRRRTDRVFEVRPFERDRPTDDGLVDRRHPEDADHSGERAARSGRASRASDQIEERSYAVRRHHGLESLGFHRDP